MKEDIKPLLSVRLITYNHENYISRAIEGVLNQKTDFPFELVIGDDCSTDGTRQIIEGYANKNPDIIRLILREQNIGMIPNGVGTLEACSGKYIALLDGDDYWTDPFKLQKQLDFLEVNPGFAICFHNMEIRFEDSERHSLLYCGNQQNLVSTRMDLATRNFMPSSSIIFRNKLFSGFPAWYFQLPFGDWALQILNAQYGDIYYIPKVMGVYNRHDQGAFSSIDTTQGALQSIQVLDALMNHFSQDQELKRQLARGKENQKQILAGMANKARDQKSLKHRMINAMIYYLKRFQVILIYVC